MTGAILPKIIYITDSKSSDTDIYYRDLINKPNTLYKCVCIYIYIYIYILNLSFTVICVVNVSQRQNKLKKNTIK